MPRLGRGRHYTSGRAAVEWTLAQLFRGGWARRLADAHPGSSRVEVTRHTFALPTWPRAAPPLTLALLTDLHAGPTTSRAALAAAFHAVAAARPDALLLGGDFVFLDARHVAELLDPLAALPCPRFAVLGNHDLWADDAHIAASLESAGVRLLTNESTSIGPLQLVGLDDPWTGHPDPPRAFQSIDPTRPIVVLAHSPEALPLLRPHRFDLLACGHTHGGHFCLPGGHPVPYIIQGTIGRHRPRGRYPLPNGASLLVSRGIGATELPFRAFSPPEALLLTLGPLPA